MDSQVRSWATGRPVGSPFATSAGWLGRAAGRFMLWTNKQHDLLELLDIGPGDRVLEVGYGGGGLLRLLTSRDDAPTVIYGVDPSPEMQRLATKNNRTMVEAGRVVLSLGSADRTGLPDSSVDHVVSVNTVALWPDLEAGLWELRRVLRPHGTVVIAWHGGSAPSRIGRRLRLSADQLGRVETALGDVFSEVSAHQLQSLDAFRASGVHNGVGT